MTVYLVTRHAPVLSWLAGLGVEGTPLAHLDPDAIRAGDVVIGHLPAHLAWQIASRGGRYLHIAIDRSLAERRTGTPQNLAGRARLIEFDIRHRADHQTLLQELAGQKPSDR